MIMLPLRSSLGHSTTRWPLGCHWANKRLTYLPPALTSCVSSNSICPATPWMEVFSNSLMIASVFMLPARAMAWLRRTMMAVKRMRFRR